MGAARLDWRYKLDRIEHFFASHTFLFWLIGSVVVVFVSALVSVTATICVTLWPNESRSFIQRLWSRVPDIFLLRKIRRWSLKSKARSDARILRLQNANHLLAWILMRVAVFIYGSLIALVVVAVLTTLALKPNAPPEAARYVFVLFFLYLYPAPLFSFLGDTVAVLVRVNKQMRTSSEREVARSAVTGA